MWRAYSTFHLTAIQVIYAPDMAGKSVTTPEFFGVVEKSLFAVKDEWFSKLESEEKENEGSLLISAGFCQICSRCAGLDGEPCRFPHRMRHSIESQGGDARKIFPELFGFPLQWYTGGKMPDYLSMIGGILKK